MKPMPYTPYEPDDFGIYRVRLGTEVRYLPGRAIDTRIAHKHLTEAECAAEYWAVSHAVEVNMKHGDALKDLVAQQIKEQHTWHRFATTPHAFRGDSNG